MPKPKVAYVAKGPRGDVKVLSVCPYAWEVWNTIARWVFGHRAWADRSKRESLHRRGWRVVSVELRERK